MVGSFVKHIENIEALMKYKLMLNQLKALFTIKTKNKSEGLNNFLNLSILIMKAIRK
jgi:hypothetical protein